MVFQKNKYGTILPVDHLNDDQYYDNLIESSFKWVDPSTNTGGYEKIKSEVINLKNRACDAAGLKDGVTIKSIINRLKDMLTSLYQKGKRYLQSKSPQAKSALDTICNYIMDAIDYIKKELS